MSKRRNNKFCSVGTTERVDVNTGESVPIEGGGMRVLPGPPGSCGWCHVKHPPENPHNQQSLPYQMKFQAIHGRWPTWTDAMAHCTPEMRQFWREELVKIMQANQLDIPDDLKDTQP